MMNDFSNDNSNKKDIIPKTEGEDLPTAETKEDRFIRNLWLYPTAKQAALEAGYSEYTASSTIYVKMKTERFRNKMREYAVANDLMALPKIGYIEDKILDYLVKNPLEASKHKHILKQKKQVAGILGDDTPKPQPTTVNIEQMRLNIWGDKASPLPRTSERIKVTEAEVIEDKTDTK